MLQRSLDPFVQPQLDIAIRHKQLTPSRMKQLYRDSQSQFKGLVLQFYFASLQEKPVIYGNLDGRSTNVSSKMWTC